MQAVPGTCAQLSALWLGVGVRVGAATVLVAEIDQNELRFTVHVFS